MGRPGTIMQPPAHYFTGDFDTQVQTLLHNVRLTASEVRELRFLFKDLEEALKIMGPGLTVQPFGSIVTGLGIKTSDVDCYIQLPGDVDKSNPRLVIEARNLLRTHYRTFTNAFAITKAKVPIVKFLHKPTKCYCDVNFMSPAGVHNSQLIGCLLRMDKSDRILQLAILVKYWSKVHNITGCNLLASYSLTLMIIFYLQLMDILPSVFEMQRTVPPCFEGNWNVAFNSYMNVKNNNFESLYHLIGGFFKCYSNLNFEENIISTFMGRLLSKKNFESLNDVPVQLGLYKDNVTANICKPLKIDTPVCIQDPFELDRNCCSAINVRLAGKIKAHFQFAARMYDELPPEQFLHAIFLDDPTDSLQTLKLKQKPVIHNKVMKHKHEFNNRQHGLKKGVNLIKAFEQISGKKVFRK